MKLIEGIQEVVNGGAPMTPSVARKVLTLFNNPVKKIKNEVLELTDTNEYVVEKIFPGTKFNFMKLLTSSESMK